MPKAKKLHSKGKTTTIQKPCKVEKDGPNNTGPEESMRQFQLELCWCIQQLERSLSEKKGNEKQLTEIWKVLTVLKNNNQPIIRKRQLMRTHFGDYRAKMAAEENKLIKSLFSHIQELKPVANKMLCNYDPNLQPVVRKLIERRTNVGQDDESSIFFPVASKIKISEVPDKPKATFFRKSAFLTTGDSSFKFDFTLPPEAVDNGNHSHGDDAIASTSAINTVPNKDNTICGVNDNTEQKTDSNTDKVKKDAKNFKFAFTSSEFKFNFDVNE